MSRSKPRLISRNQVNLKANRQVKYLSRHLGISPADLTKTAAKVGPSVAAIRKQVTLSKP